MDTRLLDLNVVPEALLRIKPSRSNLASRDLVALSGGHDFLLQASNLMCAETSFGALKLPWLTGQLDAQALAALRAGGASITSKLLQQAIAAPVQSTGSAADVLILFGVHDVLFDAENQCRVRASVRVALGSFLVVPKEPGLVHGLRPGEAVEQLGDAVSRVGQTVRVPGIAVTPQPLAMRTLSDVRPGLLGNRATFELDGAIPYSELDRHVDLGNRSSFDVSAWLGGGVLEIPASFAASGDRPSASIRVSADVSQSTAHYTELSHDAAILLSDADPLGLVLATTQRVRQRVRLPLVDDLSLVGGPAAMVNHINALAVDAFPCSRTACALNVGATIIPGRVAAHSAVNFIGSSRYGVVWSADAVRILVQFCWETSRFPRSIMQTQTGAVRLKVDGVVQLADAISDFHLDTLDAIELQYDANGRRDILYTRGLARVVPKLIRLNDGRELTPKDPSDKLFAPSEPTPWAALGELTEESLSASSPDLLLFESTVTRGVTARLGRPFIDPSDLVEVTDSRLSAPAQRVALLVS